MHTPAVVQCAVTRLIVEWFGKLQHTPTGSRGGPCVFAQLLQRLADEVRVLLQQVACAIKAAVVVTQAVAECLGAFVPRFFFVARSSLPSSRSSPSSTPSSVSSA